ncbi:MAG: alkaline phosphatase family protein [Methylophaga sp.]
MTKLVIGPVLSFRGCSEDGNWKVSALIGIQDKEAIPKLTIEGRDAGAPVLLLEHHRCKYLRYDLSCLQQDEEQRVEYRIEGLDETWFFTVPKKKAAPRIAYVSCNGFSDPNGLRKLIKSENAVWEDLLCSHDKTVRPDGYQIDKEQLWHEEKIHDKDRQRFHLLLMGGDQIYFDSIWEDIKPLKEWIGLPREKQLTYKVNARLDKKIEEYYFKLYSARWLPKERAAWGENRQSLDAAQAMSRIPTVMMWDDHDIFDGWGSYSVEMQQSPLFQRLFYHARRAFWVFQMQHAVDDLPELTDRDDINVRADDPILKPVRWKTRLAADQLALPLLDNQPGFSFAHTIGPIQLLVADLRTERSQEQVMGTDTWKALQQWLKCLPTNDVPATGGGSQHLIFMSSVPVVHPKLSLAEAFLDSFGSEHVLDSSADDLKDHWTHDAHEGERKRLIETLLNTAREKSIKVTFVSGDVHVAAWGVTYRKDVDPQSHWAQIQQLTSTAVVHPSLVSVMERLFFHVLNSVAGKKQVMDLNLEASMMLFPGSNRYVMAARNWLAIELDSDNSASPKLWATWRCETKDSFTNHLLAIEPVKLN